MLQQSVNLEKVEGRSRRGSVAVDEAARWLRPIPWQLFASLTFPWNVREETAVLKLRQFIDLLEKTYRCNVCCVGGQEAKSFRNGIRKLLAPNSASSEFGR